MVLSAKVVAIIEQNKPSRVTPQLRRIWADIEALRKAGYLYTEITELLRVHYGIEVSYKSFMSARRRICGPAKAKAQETTAVRESVAVPDDPLERARRKLASDQRSSVVLAGKVR
jgi:hypothetical protein